MDIHKPKPWHGVREFVKEIGTIVIGVLIALSAEAVVENLHERRLSAEAREAIRDELRLDVDALNARLAILPCKRRRLEEITDLLNRAEAGEPFTPATEVGSPLWLELHTQRWEAAMAGGRTSLLSSDEQREFGRVYGPVQNINKAQELEGADWSRLRALNGLRRLSPEMIYGARIAVSELRDTDILIEGGALVARQVAEELGIKSQARPLLQPGASGPHIPDICHPLTAAGDR